MKLPTTPQGWAIHLSKLVKIFHEAQRLGISPARKPRINLRPTGDGEACEDPRSCRIWRVAFRHHLVSSSSCFHINQSNMMG